MDKPEKKRISLKVQEYKIKHRKTDHIKYNIYNKYTLNCPFCNKNINITATGQHLRGAHCLKISNILFNNKEDREKKIIDFKNKVYLIKHGNFNNYDSSKLSQEEVENINITQEKIKNEVYEATKHIKDNRRKPKPKEPDEEPDEEPQKIIKKKINDYGFYEY